MIEHDDMDQIYPNLRKERCFYQQSSEGNHNPLIERLDGEVESHVANDEEDEAG